MFHQTQTTTSGNGWKGIMSNGFRRKTMTKMTTMNSTIRAGPAVNTDVAWPIESDKHGGDSICANTV